MCLLIVFHITWLQSKDLGIALNQMTGKSGLLLFYSIVANLKRSSPYHISWERYQEQAPQDKTFNVRNIIFYFSPPHPHLSYDHAINTQSQSAMKYTNSESRYPKHPGKQNKASIYMEQLCYRIEEEKWERPLTSFEVSIDRALVHKNLVHLFV